MVWDLRGALLKKQEVETARLADFEFWQRVRGYRLLAEELALEALDLIHAAAERSDGAILPELADRSGRPLDQIRALHAESMTKARGQLLEELGDPAPHRLA